MKETKITMYGKKTSAKKKKKRSFLSMGDRSNPEKISQRDYRKIVPYAERLERIELVSIRLIEKYDAYEATKTFVEYLRSTDEIFARAETENWTIEKTRHEMIQGEMHLIADHSGIDREIFEKIYDDFSQMSQNATKVQVIAKNLLEKYDKTEGEGIAHFIHYIRDYFLIFSGAIESNLSLSQTKERLVEARIESLSESSETPEHILKGIYGEFLALLNA